MRVSAMRCRTGSCVSCAASPRTGAAIRARRAVPGAASTSGPPMARPSESRCGVDGRRCRRTAELRRGAAGVLLEHLLGQLPRGKQGTDLLAETTFGKLRAALAEDLTLRSEDRDLVKLCDRALVWLHEQEVIRLNKGLAVFRPAMTVQLADAPESGTAARLCQIRLRAAGPALPGTGHADSRDDGVCDPGAGRCGGCRAARDGLLQPGEGPRSSRVGYRTSIRPGRRPQRRGRPSWEI